MFQLSLNEILIITQHLTLQEYFQLRIAVTTDLPLVPTLYPEPFFDSVKNNKLPYWNFIQLNTEYVQNWNLLAFRLTKELQLPAVKQHLQRISNSCKLNIIEYGSGDTTSLMLLESMDTDLAESLTVCCQYGYIESVKYLLSRDIDPTWNRNKPIRVAARFNHLQIVQLLLENPKVNPSDCDNEILQDAASGGRYEIVDLLMKDGRVDPSFPNDQPILIAAQKLNFRIVDLLLDDPRVDPSSHNNFLIAICSTYGKASLVERLMKDSRVSPSPGSTEALINAAKNGHLHIVKLLLADENVNPSAQANEALIAASGDGHIEIVKELVAHPKFRLGAFDFDNASDSALFFGHADVVQYLRERFVKE
ncbi:hypothetical protein HK103_005485 [Boothiomyces macroporosus]|uniref:Ankyrin repeat protein n=1 Tax=Boothiomyces macroporosus TaxID=261099 RepID=A0AAD5UFQ0_9FUNG|nr:hypothetical protein HK103_005485 [Boothiomyces macroporosus]